MATEFKIVANEMALEQHNKEQEQQIDNSDWEVVCNPKEKQKLKQQQQHQQQQQQQLHETRKSPKKSFEKKKSEEKDALVQTNQQTQENINQEKESHKSQNLNPWAKVPQIKAVSIDNNKIEENKSVKSELYDSN
jgi:hypothetical protein